MAITIKLPSSDYSLIDVLNIFHDTAAYGGVEIISKSRMEGFASVLDSVASTVFTGSGFAWGEASDGTPLVSFGTVDKMKINLGGDTFVYTNADVDLTKVSKIVDNDVLGGKTFALENYIQSQNWKITLSGADDVAKKGDTIGQGKDFKREKKKRKQNGEEK